MSVQVADLLHSFSFHIFVRDTLQRFESENGISKSPNDRRSSNDALLVEARGHFLYLRRIPDLVPPRPGYVWR